MGNATRTIVSWGGARAAQRLSRSVPWLGGAIAVLTIAGAIRRKGWIGGTLDTGLDAIPFIGALKAAVEVARGRDFVPDRPPRPVGQHHPQGVRDDVSVTGSGA
jgi:hypothetical protein